MHIPKMRSMQLGGAQTNTSTLDLHADRTAPGCRRNEEFPTLLGLVWSVQQFPVFGEMVSLKMKPLHTFSAAGKRRSYSKPLPP